jgi:hypothetical protein
MNDLSICVLFGKATSYRNETPQRNLARSRLLLDSETQKIRNLGFAAQRNPASRNLVTKKNHVDEIDY